MADRGLLWRFGDSDDAALAAIVDEMRRRLTEFRIRTRDPWLETSFQEGELPRDPRTLK